MRCAFGDADIATLARALCRRYIPLALVLTTGWGAGPSPGKGAVVTFAGSAVPRRRPDGEMISPPFLTASYGGGNNQGLDMDCIRIVHES